MNLGQTLEALLAAQLPAFLEAELPKVAPTIEQDLGALISGQPIAIPPFTFTLFGHKLGFGGTTFSRPI